MLKDIIVNPVKSTFTVLLASLFMAASPYVVADQTIDKTFNAKPNGLLHIDTDTGSINIESHQGNDIKVNIEIEGFDEGDFEIEFTQSDGGLKIEGDKKSSDWGWSSKRVRFEVSVPKQFNVKLETAGGSISVSDLTGQVDVRTSGGSLSFENIVGDINGRTSGGSIEVADTKGDVQVRTSGGSLSLGDIEGTLHARTSGGSITLGVVTGPADVATSGGSIRIREAGGSVVARTSGGSVDVTFTKQPKGDSDISTSGGSVTARLASDIAVNVYARGRKVFSDFEINGKTEAEYKLKGAINGGGPELELQTSSGSVYIRKD
ncbi:MAG: hypothetical protein HWE27_07275 [Gammaproteobacteria bacterium]|nr:hypothetical protein [Gammaproteobacteria bacterium]